MEDLIEIGVDCLQFDQPNLMGTDNLAERFGGRICFYCPVDMQTTMVNGTLEDIELDARRLMFRLGNYGGGFIGRESFSGVALCLPRGNTKAMYRAFVRHGRYPLSPP